MTAKGGRPRLRCEVKVFPIKLYCHVGEDDDLITFFENLPPRKRPVALKTALRSGGVIPTAAVPEVDETALTTAAGSFWD